MGALHNIGKNIVKKKCTGPLCELPIKTKGLCNAHYKQTLKGNELKPLKMRKYFPDEYSSWSAMRARCYKVNGKDYSNYGGRGIKVCSRWDCFEYFLLDMGPRPFKDATVERLDNEKNYSPENCFWMKAKNQSKNRRSNVLDPIKVKTILKLKNKKSVKEISEIFHCSISTAWRATRGLSWKE